MAAKLHCLVAATCLMLLVAGSTRAYEGASVLDLREWQNWSTVDCDDSVIDQCLDAKLYWDELYSTSNVRLRQVTSIANPVPQFSVYAWVDHLNDAWDADILTHGNALGRMSGEYYLLRPWRESRIEALYDQGWSEDELRRGYFVTGGDTAFTISFDHHGIRNRLAHTQGHAIIEANYCYSCLTYDDWQLNPYSGAFLCFDVAAAGSFACTDLETVMQVLGCGYGVGHYFPEAGMAASAAENTQLRGDQFARYDWEMDCHNPRASFDGAYAFDDVVAFRTESEVRSVLFFIMGVDSWSDVGKRDWKSWDVLAKVTPQGGPGISQFYSVDGIPAKAVYRVVEVDAHGRPTFSEEFVRGSHPPDHEIWLAHPTIAAAGEDRD